MDGIIFCMLTCRLALMAAIAVGADCVFLPERPPPLDQAKYGKNWEQEMCDIVQKVGNFFIYSLI